MKLIKATLAGLSAQSSNAFKAMIKQAPSGPMAWNAKPKFGTTKSMRNWNCRINNRAGTKLEKKVAKSRPYSKIK